ncbi:TetR/AcrR family transcriptional regulator [Rubellimicrobium arenae]|uniref:TetR/AcrR family transcriptional regulator n=1 Tax=Rubellimicrobium arenae TaxID=2817372 RepID=UPI001B310546|nr:TetR/AcrR family transcriptional regulator [Rubellimicrobium arenae]
MTSWQNGSTAGGDEDALDPCDSAEGGSSPKRRHSAGEDPAKRDQILDGARQVFMDQGYDAASMNDICRAAGVSKGTIYVYFSNKEELFVALMARERDRLFLDLDQLLDGDRPLRDRLHAYGCRLAELICSDDAVRAQRIIISTAERMPELGARFFDGGTQRIQGSLRRLLERETVAGRLAVTDVPLAAQQFVELSAAGLLRPRLFGKARTPPSAATIRANVDSAVRMFLLAYGAGGT